MLGDNLARINIEDDLEAHAEFRKLLPIVNGDFFAAMGRLIYFFRLAQKRHGHGEVISLAELETENLTCMIDSGWAIPEGGGYVCKNAAKHFAWYRQRVMAGKAGGEASGEARKRDEAEPSGSKRDEAEPSGSKPLTPPLVPPLSLNSKSEVVEGGVGGNAAPAPPAPSSPAPDPDFWAQIPPHAIRSWEEAYGITLVLRELPLVKAGWLSEDEFKKRKTTPSRYTRHWLQNVYERERDAPPKPPSGGPAPPETICLPTNNAAVEHMLDGFREAELNAPSPERLQELKNMLPWATRQ